MEGCSFGIGPAVVGPLRGNPDVRTVPGAGTVRIRDGQGRRRDVPARTTGAGLVALALRESGA
jgi:hypothetical protein